jgi:hypothetical protein
MRAGVRVTVGLLAVLLVPGCAAHAAGTVRPPVGAAAPSTPAPSTTAVRSASETDRSTALPTELVGRWVGDDPRHLGSWTIEIGADGSYRESNPQRGVVVEGRAAVAGHRLYLQPDDADSRAVTWEVTGGTLVLDRTTTYRRA